MIRNYDLSMDGEVIEVMLNDPTLRIHKINVNCMVKSGYTTVTLHYDKNKPRVARKRHRCIERFILFGGQSSSLDEILSNPNKKILTKHEFATEQGVIIVVDYEYLKERS